MNTKKWLALGLSVALAATAALAACAPTEPNTPDEGDNPSTPHTHSFTGWDHSDTEHWRVCPDDGELDVSSRAPHKVNKKTHTCECGYVEPHDHTYTQWAHDANQHWMVCPDDGAVDPDFPKTDHSFDEDGACECGYTLPEIYVVGHIASKPESKFLSEFRIGGTGTAGVRENCIKMERGADGKYTAEVFLHTGDWFTVADCTSASGMEYTGLERQVDADNVYILTWEPGATEISARIHDHKFVDQYGYDANEHWLVCSDADHTPDTTKTPHDFTEGNTCVCGAVKECQHENGYKFSGFTADNLPAVEAAGGTLQKTCPDCGDTQDVTYDVGVDIAGDTKVNCGGTIYRAPENITVGQNLYVADGAIYFQMAITEAGTYTVNVEAVNVPMEATAKNAVWTLGAFGLSTTQETKAATPKDLIFKKTVQSGKEADITKYNITVDGKSLTEYKAKAADSVDIHTVSFTVSADDLTEGTLYCKIVIGLEAPSESFYKTGKLRYFVSTKKETV